MSRPDDDELMQPDERLRAALRHAPDAQREPPAAVTAHILATARAAAAQASAAPAAVKRRPTRGFGAWVLARPGFALGLVALAGAAALWGLQRPGDARPVLPDPSMAQAPSADAGSEPSAPLVVAQAEMAVPAAPAAPAAIQPEPTPVAAPRKNAAQARPQAQTRSQSQARPEMHAAAPEILVMSPAPPPPAAFRPAPATAPAPVQSAAVSPAAQPVVQPVEQVVVTASAARASQAPATSSVAAADREPAVNPARAWLAALPADEPAQRAWLLALADATEGRWQEGLPAAPILETKAALAEMRRERIRLPQSLAASAAGAAEDWSPPQIDRRRAQLHLLPQGLRWCEAARCRFAPLSPEALQNLREQRPAAAAPREP